MFSCCCPKTVQESSPLRREANLKDQLIDEKQQIQENVEAKAKNQENKISVNADQYQSKQKNTTENSIQKMTKMQNQHNEKKQNVVKQNQYPPVFIQKISKINLSKKGEFKSSIEMQAEKLKAKSIIWQQTDQTSQILYLNLQKQKQIAISYKISHKSVNNHVNILNYLLSKNIKRRQSQIYLIATSKTIFEDQKLQISSDIETVFLNMRRKQSKKIFYESEDIKEIIEISNFGCLRVDVFDKIIISVESETDHSSIAEICRKITENYSLEALNKIIFIFPAFFTISDISAILSAKLHKYVNSQIFNTIQNSLSFTVDLIEDQNIEALIIVKNLFESAVFEKEEDMISKEFQNKLNLSTCFVNAEIDQNNFKIFAKVIENFISNECLTKYLKFIQFLKNHKHKSQFLQKISEFKIFDKEDLSEIENSYGKIDKKELNEYQQLIFFKNKDKQQLSELFSEYRNHKTPVDQVYTEDKQEEWDDNLRESQIRVTMADDDQDQCCSKPNILEDLEEAMVERTDINFMLHLDDQEI